MNSIAQSIPEMSEMSDIQRHGGWRRLKHGLKNAGVVSRNEGSVRNWKSTQPVDQCKVSFLGVRD